MPNYGRNIKEIKYAKQCILDDLNKIEETKERIKKICGKFVEDCIRNKGPYTEYPMHNFLDIPMWEIFFEEESLMYLYFDLDHDCINYLLELDLSDLYLE